MQPELRHDLQLRAAVRAHYTYAHPFGPMPFEDAEAKRTPGYVRAVEAAQEESEAIEALFADQRQGSLFEDMMGMAPAEWDRLGQ